MEGQKKNVSENDFMLQRKSTERDWYYWQLFNYIAAEFLMMFNWN